MLIVSQCADHVDFHAINFSLLELQRKHTLSMSKMERFVIEALIAMLLPLKKPRAEKLDIALLFAFHVVRDPTTGNTRANKLNFPHQQPARMSARSHRLSLRQRGHRQRNRRRMWRVLDPVFQ